MPRTLPALYGKVSKLYKEEEGSTHLTPLIFGP